MRTTTLDVVVTILLCIVFVECLCMIGTEYRTNGCGASTFCETSRLTKCTDDPFSLSTSHFPTIGECGCFVIIVLHEDMKMAIGGSSYFVVGEWRLCVPYVCNTQCVVQYCISPNRPIFIHRMGAFVVLVEILFFPIW